MTHPIHLAFINSTRKWGGVKTWCIDTARALNAHGITSVLFGKDPRFIDKAGRNGLDAQLIRFGFDYNPALIRRFLVFFRTHKTSCVIVNVGKDLKSAGIAARLAGIPVLQHIGSPGDVRDTWENRALYYLIRPGLLCCSEFTRAGLLRQLPYLENFKTIAVYPGVEISDHSPTPPATPTFITTSQLNENKCHTDVIAACSILKAQGLDFRLKIVGEGALSESLKQHVAREGLEEQVVFTGFTQDVTKELRTAHCFILPSRSEPLGIALEEAMANGLIPIARNAGGVPEIWPPFLKENLLPPQSRGPEFARAMEKYIHAQAEDLMHLQHQVRDHARETFSTEIQAQKVLNFIRELQQS